MSRFDKAAPTVVMVILVGLAVIGIAVATAGQDDADQSPLPPPTLLGVEFSMAGDVQPEDVPILLDGPAPAEGTLSIEVTQYGCDDLPGDLERPCDDAPSALETEYRVTALLNGRETLDVGTGVETTAARLVVDGPGAYESTFDVPLPDLVEGAHCLAIAILDDPRNAIKRGWNHRGSVVMAEVIVGSSEPVHCEADEVLTSDATTKAAGGACGVLLSVDPAEHLVHRKIVHGQALDLVIAPCDVPSMVLLATDDELMPLGQIPSSDSDAAAEIVELDTLTPGVFRAVRVLMQPGWQSADPSRRLRTVISQPVWVRDLD